jgi:DNA polymerase
VTNRKEKLVLLKTMLDLETGKVDTDAFEWENQLYEKSVQMKALNARIRSCTSCPGLNIKRFTEGCPGWGDLNAKVFFIGQSLHSPGVSSDLPFILGCGYILDAALRLSGLLRKDVFLSNCCHCHPPKNRATTDEEKKNCLQYVLKEICIVRPQLIVALGNDAKAVMEYFESRTSYSKKEKQYKPKILKVKHPASFMYSSPEERVSWIVKLSKEIDRVYK